VAFIEVKARDRKPGIKRGETNRGEEGGTQGKKDVEGKKLIS